MCRRPTFENPPTSSRSSHFHLATSGSAPALSPPRRRQAYGGSRLRLRRHPHQGTPHPPRCHPRPTRCRRRALEEDDFRQNFLETGLGITPSGWFLLELRPARLHLRVAGLIPPPHRVTAAWAVGSFCFWRMRRGQF